MSSPAQNPVENLHTALAQILSQTVILDSHPPQRKHIISFKVSQEEKQQLEQRCEGINLSEYIRAKLFDHPLPRSRRQMPQINRETLCYLKQMNTLIQQHFQSIEQKIEQGQVPLTKENKGYLLQLHKIQEEIHQLRLEMVKAYSPSLPDKDDHFG